METMSDEKKDNWEREAKAWTERANNPSDYFTRRSGFVTQLICRHRSGGRTLDVGCGSGLLSFLLADKGFDIYGTDLSENMVTESARRLSTLTNNSSERFRACIDGEVPFEGDSFDVIAAIDVLPYIEDWPRYITKLSDMVKKDGLLVLTCTNRRGLFVGISIVYMFLRLPFMLGNIKKWRVTLVNLARTGYWSGGFVDYHSSKQCYNANCLDSLLVGIGFNQIDEINLFAHPKFFDKKPFERTALGRYFARNFGWHHIGVYQRDYITFQQE